MIRVLFLAIFLFGLSVSFSGINGSVATLVAGIMAATVVLLSNKLIKDQEERDFITIIFLGGLLFRLVLGFLIYVFNLELSFGPDAITYNVWGGRLSNCWAGNEICIEPRGDNWGMHYFVGIVYYLFGANPLLVQFISSIFGALTAVFVYFFAKDLFLNRRVARYSALAVAFLPAMIIWSAQLLKDGFVIFLLVIIMFAVNKLQKRFDYLSIVILLFGLVGIWILRYYIFYIVGIAAVGALLLGTTITLPSLIRRVVVIGILIIGSLAFGIQQVSQEQIESFNLERIQKTREAASDAAVSNSSIESDVDVSTVAGAFTALPIGMINILMAPFPWQMGNLNQFLTLPEMVVWWAMFPFMFIGIKYTLKNRFRESVAIIMFSLALLLAYSIYQGNVGTLYRQRTQIQIFLLIFAAVGYVVTLEKKENQKIEKRILLNRQYSGK